MVIHTLWTTPKAPFPEISPDRRGVGFWVLGLAVFLLDLGVLGYGVGVISEFVWCEGDPSVVAGFVRSGSVVLPPVGGGVPEWSVLLDPGLGVLGWLGDVAGVVGAVCRGVSGEECVVWRGSVREWVSGEWAVPHSDVFDDGGVLTVSDALWHRWADFTVVLFLESGGGGELVFPELGCCVVPRAGCGVVFPSAVLHGVEPVVGSRLSVVFFVSRARVLARAVSLLPAGWDVDVYDASPVWGLL